MGSSLEASTDAEASRISVSVSECQGEMGPGVPGAPVGASAEHALSIAKGIPMQNIDLIISFFTS